MLTIGGTTPITTEAVQRYMDPAMYAPETTTYLAIVATGMELGKGSLMIQAVKVDPASTNTVVKITSGK
jgi:hypothetical protein